MAQHGQALDEGTEYPGTGPPPGNAILYIFGPPPVKGHWITVQRLLSGVSSGTTPPAQLPAPSSLRQTSNTTTSITVAWSAVANATGYKVRLNGGTTFMPGTATSYTIQGFAATSTGTTATIEVQAIGSGNYTSSDYSASIQGSTQATTQGGTVTPGTAQGSDSVTFTSATAS